MCSRPLAQGQGPLGPVGHLMPAAHLGFAISFFLSLRSPPFYLFAVSYVFPFAVSFIVISLFHSLFFLLSHSLLFVLSHSLIFTLFNPKSTCLCSGPWAQGQGPLGPVGHLIRAARWGFAFSFIIHCFCCFLIDCLLFHPLFFLLSHSLIFILFNPKSNSLCSTPSAQNQGPMGPVVHLMPASHLGFAFSFVGFERSDSLFYLLSNVLLFLLSHCSFCCLIHCSFCCRIH